MANNNEESKRNPLFTYFPFGIWLVIVLIGISQNGGINKLRAMQGATAATDKRSQLIQCYAKFNVNSPEVVAKLNALNDQQVKDLLFECNERLNNNGSKQG
jgi:hypothetical protein